MLGFLVMFWDFYNFFLKGVWGFLPLGHEPKTYKIKKMKEFFNAD